MTEIIGWISTICFTIAGLPQVLKTIREGHASGVSIGFLIFWSLGNLTGGVYAYLASSIPLMIGFFTSIAFGLVIWKYKLWRRQ